MTMISKLTTAAGTTVTKSLCKDGRVQKVINFSPASKMAKMQLKEMSILKGKNGGIDVVCIRNPETDRRWFLGTNYTKEGLTKALKQFIANQKQTWGL